MGLMEQLEEYQRRQARMEGLVMTVQRDMFLILEEKPQIIYDTFLTNIMEKYFLKPSEAKKIINAVFLNCETLEFDGIVIKIRKN